MDALFEAADALGPVDILVNNAGITRDGLLPAMSDEDWLDVLDTNTTACFRMCRAASLRMMRSRKGSIINITSISGLQGNAGQCNYSALKAAVIGRYEVLGEGAWSSKRTRECSGSWILRIQT